MQNLEDIYYICVCIHTHTHIHTHMVVQKVKNPLAMQETPVRFLVWEDPLEKGMAIPSSILAWKIPWTEEPGGLQSTGGHRESDMTE